MPYHPQQIEKCVFESTKNIKIFLNWMVGGGSTFLLRGCNIVFRERERERERERDRNCSSTKCNIANAEIQSFRLWWITIMLTIRTIAYGFLQCMAYGQNVTFCKTTNRLIQIGMIASIHADGARGHRTCIVFGCLCGVQWWLAFISI